MTRWNIDYELSDMLRQAFYNADNKEIDNIIMNNEINNNELAYDIQVQLNNYLKTFI